MKTIFSDLPEVLIEEIFKLLQLKDLLSCMLVCKSFYLTGSANAIWIKHISSYLEKHHPALSSDSFRNEIMDFFNETGISTRHLLVNTYLEKKFTQLKRSESDSGCNNTQPYRSETSITSSALPISMAGFPNPHSLFSFGSDIAKFCINKLKKRRSSRHQSFFKDKPASYIGGNNSTCFPVLNKTVVFRSSHG